MQWGVLHQGVMIMEQVKLLIYEDKMTGNCSDIQQENIGAGKQKRISRIAGGGLQQLSITVCKKVESKGTTSFSEVADEIIADFAAMHKDKACLDEFDEKNIRRRVYDALNVLMALDIICKECKDKKKEIQWKGLPSTKIKDIEKLEALHVKLMRSIAKKTSYLQELEEQVSSTSSYVIRNCMSQEISLQKGFLCHFYSFKHTAILQLRLKFPKTCSWFTSTSTAHRLCCTMMCTF